MSYYTIQLNMRYLIGILIVVITFSEPTEITDECQVVETFMWEDVMFEWCHDEPDNEPVIIREDEIDKG